MTDRVWNTEGHPIPGLLADYIDGQVRAAIVDVFATATVFTINECDEGKSLAMQAFPSTEWMDDLPELDIQAREAMTLVEAIRIAGEGIRNGHGVIDDHEQRSELERQLVEIEEAIAAVRGLYAPQP